MIPEKHTNSKRRSVPPWLIILAFCSLMLLPLFLNRAKVSPSHSDPEVTFKVSTAFLKAPLSDKKPPGALRRSPGTQSPAEVIAARMQKFAQIRRELVHKLAARLELGIPAEMDRFFDAADAGDLMQMEALLDGMRAVKSAHPDRRELFILWRPLIETVGAMEQVKSWPPQALLDYGNEILQSLRPGQVYFGGTDSGCFIPTMLNETDDGEKHITMTQNALADSTYLEYIQMVHGDSLVTPTKEDSDRAFQEYISGATKRYLHDQEFPGEPRQVLPGESIEIKEGKTVVSGQVAVMAINERITRAFLEKNPDTSFAMEQSAPFPGLYPTASINGPLLDLRSQNPNEPFSSESAGAVIGHWENVAQTVTGDPDLSKSPEVLKTYSHNAAAQAQYLMNRGYFDEAGKVFQTASKIWPGNPEATDGLLALRDRSESIKKPASPNP